MKTYWHNLHSMTGANWSYVVSWSIISLAQFGFTPVLFNLYLQQLRLGKGEIGLFLGAGTLTMGLCALPASYLGSRISPQKAFTIGLLIPSFGWILFLLAPIFPQAALGAVILTGQFLVYLGVALFLVNGIPYFMQISTETNRVFIIGFQQVAQGLMGLAGSLLAGILPGALVALAGNTITQIDSYRGALLLQPIVYVAAFLIMWRTPPVAFPAVKGSSPVIPAQAGFPAKTFAYFILIVLLMAVGMGGLNSFFNLFLNDLGYTTGQIGSLLSITQIMPFLSAATVPLMNLRLKVGTIFGLSNILAAASALLLSINNLPLIIVICLVTSGYASAVNNTLRSLYGQQLVDPRWRTYISAANTIAMAIGFTLASTVGGTVIKTSGFTALFELSAAAALACGLITFIYPRLAAALSRKIPAVPLEIE